MQIQKESRFEKDPYNSHQNFLYNRALYGLSIYSKEEIEQMTPEKKKRIVRIHKKSQMIINLWKQEMVNKTANKLFTDIFPDMDITKSLIQFYGTEGDPSYINSMSFKFLNISKKQVIEKLIETKVLPKNFNQLNKENESRISSKRSVVPSPNTRHNIGRRVAQNIG